MSGAKYVAAAPAPFGDSEWLTLWEVEELIKQARKHGLPDEAEFRIEHDANFLQNRYVVVHRES